MEWLNKERIKESFENPSSRFVFLSVNQLFIAILRIAFERMSITIKAFTSKLVYFTLVVAMLCRFKD